MIDYRGKTVLITGASSGLGAAFARALAARGAASLLVARSEDKLDALARSLAAGGASALALPADLARPGVAAGLAEELARRGRAVDILINSAGFATYGPFEGLAPEREQEEIALNVAAPVALTRALLPGMLDRGFGAVVNVASIASFQPVPYMAVYGATKAFVLSFSEALWAEGRRRGVRVLALCPGPVDTAFFDVVGAEEARLGKKASPESVVEAALRALSRGKSYVIPGRGNYVMSNASRLAPRSLVASMSERAMRPRGRGKLPAAGAALL